MQEFAELPSDQPSLQNRDFLISVLFKFVVFKLRGGVVNAVSFDTLPAGNSRLIHMAKCVTNLKTKKKKRKRSRCPKATLREKHRALHANNYFQGKAKLNTTFVKSMPFKELEAARSLGWKRQRIQQRMAEGCDMRWVEGKSKEGTSENGTGRKKERRNSEGGTRRTVRFSLFPCIFINELVKVHILNGSSKCQEKIFPILRCSLFYFLLLPFVLLRQPLNSSPLIPQHSAKQRGKLLRRSCENGVKVAR